MSEDVQKFFEFARNAQTAAAAFSGLSIGLIGGWFAAYFLSKRFVDLSKLEVNRLKDEIEKKDREIAQESNARAKYEAEAKSLRERLKTIRCFCGASMERKREYQKRNSFGGDDYDMIELKCEKPTCAHAVSFEDWELKELIKKMNLETYV